MKERWSDKKVILARLVVAFALAAAYAIVAHALSAGLEISRPVVAIEALPKELDGLRIAQISDFHSSRYGDGQTELIEAIHAFHPDIIAVTGDTIDGRSPEPAPCEELVRGLSAIAPVYLCMGNNEYYLEDEAVLAFAAGMRSSGARVLVNDSEVFEKNGARILVSGMDDPARFLEEPRAREIGGEEYAMELASASMAQIRKDAPGGDFALKIMLCHEPQFCQLWKDAGYGLALCGHLHGWVFRAPGIGGVLRMPSRYFPEEDAGLYDKQGTMVYISRGLDNRNVISNFRMNNKPELVLMELKSK